MTSPPKNYPRMCKQERTTFHIEANVKDRQQLDYRLHLLDYRLHPLDYRLNTLDYRLRPALPRQLELAGDDYANNCGDDYAMIVAMIVLIIVALFVLIIVTMIVAKIVLMIVNSFNIAVGIGPEWC